MSESRKEWIAPVALAREKVAIPSSKVVTVAASLDSNHRCGRVMLWLDCGDADADDDEEEPASRELTMPLGSFVASDRDGGGMYMKANLLRFQILLQK